MTKSTDRAAQSADKLAKELEGNSPDDGSENGAVISYELITAIINHLRSVASAA